MDPISAAQGPQGVGAFQQRREAFEAQFRNDVDSDGDGQVSKADFVKFLEQQKTLPNGKQVGGLSEEAANKLAEKLFGNNNTLSVDDLQKGLEASRPHRRHHQQPDVAVSNGPPSDLPVSQPPDGYPNEAVNILT